MKLNEERLKLLKRNFKQNIQGAVKVWAILCVVVFPAISLLLDLEIDLTLIVITSSILFWIIYLLYIMVISKTKLVELNMPLYKEK